MYFLTYATFSLSIILFSFFFSLSFSILPFLERKKKRKQIDVDVWIGNNQLISVSKNIYNLYHFHLIFFLVQVIENRCVYFVLILFKMWCNVFDDNSKFIAYCRNIFALIMKFAKNDLCFSIISVANFGNQTILGIWFLM